MLVILFGNESSSIEVDNPNAKKTLVQDGKLMTGLV